MSSYVHSVLTSNERVRYHGRVSVWSLAPMILLGVVLLPAFFIGALFLVAALLRYVSTEMAVTNKRVIAKQGFIRRSTIELNLARVESIQVDQGILGRIFDFGSIVVSGSGNPQAPVIGISQPLRFRKAVVEAQEDASSANGCQVDGPMVATAGAV